MRASKGEEIAEVQLRGDLGPQRLGAVRDTFSKSPEWNSEVLSAAQQELVQEDLPCHAQVLEGHALCGSAQGP